MRQSAKDLERVLQFLQGEDFGQNQRLPAERELAERLGLTRNRLRGSLRKLAADGLIWRHVGKGTFFGPRPTSATPQDLSELTNPREVMEVRFAIEPEIARLAAFRANTRDVVEMQACLEKMIATDDWNDWGFWGRPISLGNRQGVRQYLDASAVRNHAGKPRQARLG